MPNRIFRTPFFCLLFTLTLASQAAALTGTSVGAESSPVGSPPPPETGTAFPEGFDVPAYSTTGWNSPGYVGLDATVPGDLVVIEQDQPTNVFAATFIGNDFDRHYVLASSGGDLEQDTFGWIDTDTGQFTEIGVIDGGPGETWTSMAWDYATETLYAMAVDTLYVIDPDQLEATLVGNVEGDGLTEDSTIITIASAADGRMFGIDIEENTFIEIDSDTAQATVVGDLSLDPTFAQDMDFDHRDGTLYWAAYFGGGDSEIRTIDIETAESTSLGEVDGGAELNSFTLAVPAEMPIVSIEPDSISVQLDVDATTQEALEIGNLAQEASLQWSFTSASEPTISHDPSPRGLATPAYSTTGWNSPGYVGLDATVPGDLVVIEQDQPTNVFAATFIGNDFDRHYVLASSGGDLEQDTFGWIDTDTGQFTEIGLIDGGPGETWTSMAWDYATETLYAMAVDTLYVIDPDQLEATPIDAVQGDGLAEDPTIIAIASAVDGRLFGIEIEENTFIEIDPDNAQATIVGDLDLDPIFAQDMDFDHRDGTLYWAAYFGGGDSEIRIIDIDTAASTSLGEVDGGAELNSFTLAVPWAPPCQLPGDVPWLAADILSGNVTPGDSQTVTLDIDADGLEPGLHQTTLCLETNDPVNALIAVPIELEISGSPEIFHDRFEQN